MKSAEMNLGRIFVLKLEEGEILHESIEAFCSSNGIIRATVTAVGGADSGSVIVVGPKIPIEKEITPQTFILDAPCELTGTGTVFPDTDGNPIMHMHGSLGRSGQSITGCFRKKVVVWLTMEVVICELLGGGPYRAESDPRISAKLLQIT